jgi:uncharacterized membrane protein (UPF0127 family)
MKKEGCKTMDEGRGMMEERRKKREAGRILVWERLSVTFFVFLIFFLFFSSLVLRPSSFLFVPSHANADSPTQVCFHDRCFIVETMDTQEKRSRGLQDRTSLPADQGMLFVFPTEDIFNFWMKDTLITLDMIWVNEALKIVDLKTDVPPCIKEPCPLYIPSAKARYVLEFNAHFTQTHGLKVGDEVVIK